MSRKKWTLESVIGTAEWTRLISRYTSILERGSEEEKAVLREAIEVANKAEEGKHEIALLHHILGVLLSKDSEGEG